MFAHLSHRPPLYPVQGLLVASCFLLIGACDADVQSPCGDSVSLATPDEDGAGGPAHEDVHGGTDVGSVEEDIQVKLPDATEQADASPLDAGESGPLADSHCEDASEDEDAEVSAPPCDLPFVSPLCDTCSAGYELVPIDIDGVPGISCAALGPVWGNSPLSPFGVYLAEDVLGASVVTDIRTQMMWQVATPDTTAALDGARAFCDDSTSAGFADWRLPYVHELTSLVDFDIMAPDPSLSASQFPGTSPTHYWTYNDVVDGTTGAWMVSFGDATLTVGLLDAERRIRCVRPVGGYAVDAARFDHTATADVTLDTWTGLTWQQQSQAPSTWSDAKAYCATLELAGQSDWRLPSVRELYGLADYRLREPALDDVAFPDAASDVWWSRSGSVDDASQAWGVDFEFGSMAVDSVDAVHPGRCVRGD